MRFVNGLLQVTKGVVMPKKQRITGSGGARKHGRMLRKPAYVRYLAEHRREKNKARKLKRYMEKFPNWKPTISTKEIRV